MAVITYDQLNLIIENLSEAVVDSTALVTNRLKLGDLNTRNDIVKSTIYMEQGLRVLETYIFQLDNSDYIYLEESDIETLIEQLREATFYVFGTKKI